MLLFLIRFEKKHVLKTNWIIFLAAFFFAATGLNAQNRGQIILPASPAANPMNPNGDTWVTKQNGLFTLAGNPTGYYVSEFETRMFGLPKVGTGEVSTDNQNGTPCGFTDLIPDLYGYSVYGALVPFAYPSQATINNLMFRFRLGDNASPVSSWSILIDVDNRFGAGIDPNATANNPGFELEITLINKNNPGVFVSYVDGIQSCPTPFKSYPLGSNYQVAVGDTQSCNDPDYFYDFFVTVPDLIAAYNASNPTAQVTSASGFRFVAATSQSSNCFFGGSNADIGGVDNNVAPYSGSGGIVPSLTAVVTGQCPTAIESLCSTCEGFETGNSWKPTINPVAVGDTQVSGTTKIATYVKLSVFSLVSPGVYATTPRFTQTVYSTDGTWTVNLSSSPLQNNDKVVAHAQLTADGSSPCDQYNSDSSTSTTIVTNYRPVANPQTLSTPEDTPLSITLTATDGNPGDVLSYTYTQPLHGTVTGSGANVIYTPSLNYTGPDSFTFTASDTKAQSTPATISITVVPVNDIPVANNQNVSTNEDTPLSITLSATDVETPAASLTYASSTPAHGTLSCSNCSNPTYTPALNYNGPDSFTFTASDGSGTSSPATVSITVNPVNDAPVANDQSVTVIEDTPKLITLTGSDVEGSSLTYTVLTNPTHGTLSVSGASVTYTPALNYNGPDTFTFKVNDGSVDSNIATVSITVTPVNDAPVATNQSLTTPEDTALPITLSATDVDNGSLTYAITAQPQHGQLSVISGAGLTYTPDLNFFGQDSFDFTASDGSLTSNTATVSINVTPVNDAPVANNQSITINEDETRAITLTASDVDGDALTYSIVAGPTNGTLTGTAPNVTYTPDANYNGSDSFTFKANDGTVDSNVATITITINAINDAPVASGQSVTTNEDTAVGITLVATDVDAGTTLTYSIVTAPLHGTLTGTAPNLTYTPALNYNGPDSFTFTASDGSLTSNTATVSITVTPVNDAPVANDQSITINEDETRSITLTGSDVDGDALTYSIVAGPTNGTLTGTAPNLSYTPNANYNGSDSFTFKVNDGTVDSNVATITITITAINDAPVASGESVTTNEDTAVGITLVATDVDAGTTLTYSIVTAPLHGTLTGTAPNLTYTPALNYNGPDSFTFTASDGSLTSNTATVSITVTPVNDAPVANDQSITINEDETRSITLTGSDVDGDALTYSIVAGPSNGTLTGTAPNLSYTPNANYNGSDSFTFKVNDGTVDSNVATITITINAINDAPVASGQSVTTNEDTAVGITLVATDVDAGTTLTYSIVTAPLHGTLTGTAPNLTYTPALNYNGPDSFTFTASDGSLTSNTATVSITVTPVNDTPVANSQSVSVNEDASVLITLTGSDIDNDPLTYIIVTPPTHGVLTGTGANITYTPTANYSGPDSFTFKVNDGTADSSPATVTITVNPLNDAPVALDKTVLYLQNVAVSFTIEAVDADPTDVLTFTVLTQPANGTLTGTAPNLTFTPALNFTGTTTFTFKVNDGTVDSNIATVTLRLDDGISYPPIAFDQTLSVNEDNNLNILLVASDANGDPLTYTIVSGPTHGTITSGTGSSRIYTPALNYNGPDSFTFKANDGTNDSNIATVSITVNPVNDAPIANDQTVTVTEDIAKAITLTGSDVEGSTLTYTVITQPTRGVLTGTGANLTYTPNANYNGSDNFTFKVNDGQLDSSPATVSITVDPVNDIPVATPQTLTTAEDTPLPIVLVGTDVEGATLTYTVTTLPTHGTLTGTAPNLTYTPDLNYNGPDSFAFKVNDGLIDSAPATIAITVTPVNDVPIANAQTVTVTEDVAKAITLTGSDVEGSTLTYTVITAPTRGVLTGTGANLTYTPNLNYNGPDNFTFKVNDGQLDSSPATVSITVDPINDIPVATPQTLTTAEDTPLPIVLVGTDVEGATLTYTVTTLPTHGTLSCTDCAAPTYTPDLNYNGPDSFAFKVNDGLLDSSPSTIAITVTPVNDVPIANAQTVIVTEDVAKAIVLTGSDVEGSTLTYTVVTLPTRGVLSGSGANLIYTPNANYNGSDSFTFKVNDGTVDSNIATVSITVNPVNDTPVATAQTLSTAEETPLPIVLVGTDNDGNPLTYTVTTLPTHGTLSCTNCATPTYTPDLNYNGPDNFAFKVNDGLIDSAPATISITVTPVNDVPIADAQTVIVTEDIAKVITLTGSDVEGSTLTFTVLTQPADGVLTGSGANLTYTPNANFNGFDSFTFKVNDGTVDSNIATVSITVNSVNDLPVAVNDNATTNEDNAVSFSITQNDTDVDGVIIPATVDLDPSTPGEDKTLTTAEGVFSVSNLGVVTFTPVANFNGTSTITYTVKDDQTDLSNSAQIVVTVVAVNDAPVVTAKTVDVLEDVPTSVCFLFTDIENDPAVFSTPDPISFGGNGVVAIDPLTGAFCFKYTPNPDYNGPDEVRVTVCDTVDPTLCNTGVITINVVPVNDAPRVIVDDNSVIKIDVTTLEDTPLASCFTVIDPDGDSFSSSNLTNVSGGGALNIAAGAANQLCLNFTPTLNANGMSTWTFNICDSATPSLCNTFTLNIDVTPVNDTPIADAKSVTTVEETPVAITLTGSDVDGDVITYFIFEAPLHGVLSGTGANITYTPDNNYSGADQFTYKVNDGTADSDVATVTINVTPVNDPPIIVPVPAYETPEDTSVKICISTTDPDGDVLTFSSPVNLSGGGTMTIDASGTCFVFAPAKDFNGVATWKFKVCDTGNPALCTETTVSINVTPVNDPPVAVNDYITVKGPVINDPLNLLDNDFDVDGDPLTMTIVAVAGPFHGSIVTMNSDGKFEYVANQGFVGSDSVRYKVCDNANPALCDEGVLFIEVEYPPFKFYNAVSPNGDGLNDYWRIDSIEAFPNNKVNIFDRYNNLIFEMNGYDNDQKSWSGQINHSLIKGTASDGTYYYVMDLGDGSGLQSGYIVLRKEQ